MQYYEELKSAECLQMVLNAPKSTDFSLKFQTFSEVDAHRSVPGQCYCNLPRLRPNPQSETDTFASVYYCTFILQPNAAIIRLRGCVEFLSVTEEKFEVET